VLSPPIPLHQLLAAQSKLVTPVLQVVHGTSAKKLRALSGKRLWSIIVIAL
jgi:hypothetical protein